MMILIKVENFPWQSLDYPLYLSFWRSVLAMMFSVESNYLFQNIQHLTAHWLSYKNKQKQMIKNLSKVKVIFHKPYCNERKEQDLDLNVKTLHPSR